MRRPPRLLLLAVTAALALPAVACSSSPPSCADPTTTTSVELSNFEYAPACTAATAADTLTITNTSDTPHTFTVKGTDVNVSVDGGKTAEIALTGIQPGTYAVVCQYHPQMVGALKVTG
ncbi:MAG: cupredoxin domain-containing protein [Planctomycetaceae bacterium]